MTTETTPQTAVASRRSGRLVGLGVLVLVGMVIVAGVLWFAGGQRRADNVANFARAPVGCDTTLDFDRTGEFVVFVETTGRLDVLAGACDAALDYDREADDDLAMQLAPGLLLTDPEGSPVDIVVTPGGDYDVDGFVGTASWIVTIDEPGDYVLTVSSIGGDPFAIAVGRSADDGVGPLRLGAVVAVIIGLVVGGALLVVGSRRTFEPEEPSAEWTPSTPSWPSSPPGFPVPPPTTGAVGPPTPSGRSQGTNDGPDTPAPPASPWGPPSAPSS